MASIFKQKDVWHVKFYLRGTAYRKSLGTASEHKAIRAMQRLENRLADLKAGFLKLPVNVDAAEFLVRGEVVRQEDADTTAAATFAEVRPSYFEHVSPRRAPSSFATEKIHLHHFEGFLKRRVELPLSDITTADIEGYATQRRKAVSGTTVNKELQTLRQFFDYALRHSHIKVNPTYNVPRFKKAGRPHRFMTKAEIDDQIERGGLSDDEVKGLLRFRYLEPEEIARLLALTAEREPWLHPILATLAYTGMRRGELISLEWGDVDFKRRKIWVRSRKQSRSDEFAGRDIDMHAKILNILATHRKRHPKGRFVFPGPDGNALKPDVLHRSFKTLIKGSDFDGIGFHCLRHTFASNLASQGVDDRLIDHYMGHQTVEMRHRYQHLFPDKKAAGIHKLTY